MKEFPPREFYISALEYKAETVAELEGVNEPPCKQCKWWMPRIGKQNGDSLVRFCWTPKEQERDFGCFEPKDS